MPVLYNNIIVIVAHYYFFFSMNSVASINLFIVTHILKLIKVLVLNSLFSLHP